MIVFTLSSEIKIRYERGMSAHAFDSLVTKADLKTALHELELRLTMRMGAIGAASTALTVAIVGGLIAYH
jgi:hypothetical protein